MVTGAYWPELSGGGLQCRSMIHALRDRIDFRVLTTATDPSLPANAIVEGARVTRLYVDVRRPVTKVRAAFATIAFFITQARTFQIVHLHGFSQKSVLITCLARLFGKRIVITIHTADHDEPQGVRRLGRLAYWCYSNANRFVAISERIAANYRSSGLPASRLDVIPNGVDTMRFSPSNNLERESLRRAIAGSMADAPWILFVGFFSADKRPDVLFHAWLRLVQSRPHAAALVFVGATQSAYHEVDTELAARIQSESASLGVSHLVHFAGEVPDVERYYRAADLFVMPSTREAFGMALVEAMSCALPVVATRIPGVTDTIVNDDATGRLVPGGDVTAFSAAISALLADPARAAEMGRLARASVEQRFDVRVIRERWFELYRETCR